MTDTQVCPYRSRQHVQKPYLQIELSALVSQQQTLGLHARRFSAPLRETVILRIDYSEVPSLAVLDRRRPVWIKDISFVEQGIDDSFHEFEIHHYLLTESNHARMVPLPRVSKRRTYETAACLRAR